VRRASLTALLALLVALLSACGGSDEQGGPSTAPAAGPAQAAFAVSAGTTTLAIDEQTAGVLVDNGLEVAAVEPAADTGSVPRNLTLRFPIIGGEIRPDTFSGRIEHRGGLSVSDGRNRVVFRALVVDLAARQLTANAGAGRIALLNLDVGPSRRSESNGILELSGVLATLSATAANALSGVLKTAVLRAAQVVGTLTIRVER
jgi:hypothetical protein